MALTFTVPQEYGWVLLTASGTYALGVWLSFRSTTFRKAAKVPLPNQMVTPKTRPTKTDPGMTHEEFLFNCAQRGHGNYLENQSTFLPALLVVGVQYPLTCSVSGAVWIVSRAVYAVGYTKPEWGNMGTGRFRGALHYFPPLVIYGLAVYSGVKMILS